MARFRWLAAAAFAALTFPAVASVVVLGSSSARLCYLAADRGLVGTNADLHQCDTALASEPLSLRDRVATHVNRGILRLRRGQIEGAVADFDAGIALDPAQAEAYHNKGAAMMRANNAREALPLFTLALEKNTSRPALAHFGRAIAYESLGDLPAAYADYRRASELDPAWRTARAELQRFRIVPQ